MEGGDVMPAAGGGGPPRALDNSRPRRGSSSSNPLQTRSSLEVVERELKAYVNASNATNGNTALTVLPATTSTGTVSSGVAGGYAPAVVSTASSTAAGSTQTALQRRMTRSSVDSVEQALQDVSSSVSGAGALPHVKPPPLSTARKTRSSVDAVEQALRNLERPPLQRLTAVVEESFDPSVVKAEDLPDPSIQGADDVFIEPAPVSRAAAPGTRASKRQRLVPPLSLALPNGAGGFGDDGMPSASPVTRSMVRESGSGILSAGFSGDVLGTMAGWTPTYASGTAFDFRSGSGGSGMAGYGTPLLPQQQQSGVPASPVTRSQAAKAVPDGDEEDVKPDLKKQPPPKKKRRSTKSGGSSSTKKRTYECRFCSHTFTDWSNRRRHEDLHKGIKRYHCAKCNKGFANPTNKKTHEKACKG